MDNMTMLKPAALVLKGRGDPEQLARDWEDYLETSKPQQQSKDTSGNELWEDRWRIIGHSGRDKVQ